MKRTNLKLVAALLAGSMVCTSCIGPFKLFNKYEEWQCNMTSSKIVNGIVGFILQPIVGTICLFVDAVVLNTIEFWSGNNPVAFNGTKTVKGRDGRFYAIKSNKKGYEVKAENGDVTYFIHDCETDTWSVKQNGTEQKLFSYNEDGSLQAYLQNGSVMTVTNDVAGLSQVREAVENPLFFASR